VLGRMTSLPSSQRGCAALYYGFLRVTPESRSTSEFGCGRTFAHNAGMRCVSVNWGFRSVEEILAAAYLHHGRRKAVRSWYLHDPGNCGVC
jgi:hypothetical protein